MKAILTIGTSASGKTTWAKKQGKRIICRDDIRREILGITQNDNLWEYWQSTKENETEVNDILLSQINNAASKGEDIIIADTNIAQKKLGGRNGLILHLEKQGYQVKTKVFDTNIYHCLLRDKFRVDRVGDSVIWNQWALLNHQGIIKQDILPDDIVVCDIDGTVARMTGRDPRDYSRVMEDKVRLEVVHAMLGLCEASNALPVFVSGRQAWCRPFTETWLTRYVCYKYKLFMRCNGDHRKDTVVKEEIYNTFLKEKNIIAVFDDRPSVVDMWNDKGLTVFAVADQRNKF